MKKTKDGREIIKSWPAPKWFIDMRVDAFNKGAELCGSSLRISEIEDDTIDEFRKMLAHEVSMSKMNRFRQYVEAKIDESWALLNLLNKDIDIADNLNYDPRTEKIHSVKTPVGEDGSMPEGLRKMLKGLLD